MGSLTYAENSTGTGTDELRISTRTSQIDGHTQPKSTKNHTKSYCSLNLASLISPKYAGNSLTESISKGLSSAKNLPSDGLASFHKKKFSEPSLNIKAALHQEEKNHKTLLNNYTKPSHTEKEKLFTTKNAHAHKESRGFSPQLQNNQVLTPGKERPKKVVPALQISPFIEDPNNKDKRNPESSQLYRKLLDMLHVPARLTPTSTTSNVKTSAKLSAHLNRPHNQK